MSSGGRTWSFKSTYPDTILTAILIQGLQGDLINFHFSQNPNSCTFRVFRRINVKLSKGALILRKWEKSAGLTSIMLLYFCMQIYFLAVNIKVISFLVPRLGSEFITRPHQFLHDRKFNWNEVSESISYDAQELLLIHFREMHASK